MAALSSHQVEPLARHQGTFYLSFSPKTLPYAELAAYHLAAAQAPKSAPAHSIRVGLDHNLLAPAAVLTVPKGPFAAEKTTLTGKTNIVRFFSRVFAAGPAGASALSTSSLYPESAPELKARIDDWIDRLRTAPGTQLAAADVVKALEAAAPTKALVGTATTIADLLAWDALLATGASSPKLAGWLKSIHSAPALANAAATIDGLVETAPQLDVFRFEIVSQICALTGSTPDVIYPLLEEPRDRKNGDISLPLPRARLPGNPIELATSLAQKFKCNDLITKAAAAGPFLNFTYNRDTLRNRTIASAVGLGPQYGANATGFGNFGIVEFSSPNIAKPFHAGHLRSTIIGSFIKNVLDASGWGTVSINYLGDWGKQYGLLAVGYERYGNDEELEKDPIRHLFHVYVKVNNDASENPAVHDEARAYFKKMEDGDAHAYGLWKRFRDLSIVKYKEIYGRLNVQFDIYSGESQYSLGQMRDVLHELQDLGLLVPDQGALIVDLKQFDLGVAVIGKTDGSLLYLSRDIAAAIDRKKVFDFDRMFYVVGNQQIHHFKQLFKILELQGKTWAEKCEHIGFGIIRSKDGNMSTRKGTVVFLEDILDEAGSHMHEQMRKNEVKYAQIPDPDSVADVVGQSATMIQDMTARRSKDYNFDWDRIFSFEGDTGPYLQYAHSRLCSIERQAAPLEVTPEELQSIDFSLLTEPQAFTLVEAIAAYPDVLREAGKTLEPCTIVSFALNLSHAVSSAIDVLWVSGQAKPLAHARLALYVAARITLGNALRLLGLKPLTRM
ncbi:arginyl-tRNA synthetase [Polyrhizophydium stewartii]|uniref:arginine--tRNA ligase n=1 Tax=Polyrhizophydium stewartii TaxID=2732419 RepID=A0ABR4NAH5_9FUNG|nr:hypothetical protein HK105_003992 [Polyrhizophydium stewartii]